MEMGNYVYLIAISMLKSVHKTELLAVSFYLFIALKFSHAEFEL